MKLRTALATLPALVVASFASTAHAVTPIDIDVGNEHACIVSDCDMTQCWGGPNNTFGEAADRAGEAFEVAVGMDHTCTLDGPAALPNYLKRGFVPFHTEVYEATIPADPLTR